MTSADRFNSTNAEPSKAKLAQGDELNTKDDNCLIELDLSELNLVGGARGKFGPEF